MSKALQYTTKTFASSYSFTDLTSGSEQERTILESKTFDRRIYGALVYSTSGSSKNVNFYLYQNNADFQIAEFNISAGKGTDGTTMPLELFNDTDIKILLKQRDADGNFFFHLPAGCSLKAGVVEQLESLKKINFVFWGESY